MLIAAISFQILMPASFRCRFLLYLMPAYRFLSPLFIRHLSAAITPLIIFAAAFSLPSFFAIYFRCHIFFAFRALCRR